MTTTFKDWGVAGLLHEFTFDGVDFEENPASSSFRTELKRTQWDSADGGRKIFAPYLDPYFPNLIRRAVFELRWDNVHDEMLERLREAETDGREHRFTPWVREKLIYIATDSQAIFKFPYMRLNAPQVYSRSTVDFPLSFEVNGVERVVAYKTSVADDDAVTSGEVWVSATQPKMKTNPALNFGDIVRVNYYPVHLILFDEMATEYPETVAESRTFTFGEVRHA